MNRFAQATVFAAAVAATTAFAGTSFAATRGATNAIEARKAHVQQDAQAYALTGEQQAQRRSTPVSHNAQGGRSAY